MTDTTEEYPASEEHSTADESVGASGEKTVQETEGVQAQPFTVVGMGASAGGLEALVQFFDECNEDTGLAFVIVQHLSPDSKSLMPELLSRHTSMPVKATATGEEVVPDHVYLIPPGKNMTIVGGKLMLATQDRSGGLNLPIDLFFESLAHDLGHRSVAIVLSGTGSDGARGIRAIKEAGGMVMVQDETTAKFDGMPRSAVSTGLADFVLPPSSMPGTLVGFAKHPYIKTPAQAEPKILTDEENLQKILGLLKVQVNVDFTQYKYSTVGRRIQRRMGINQIDSLSKYLGFIRQSPREVSTLYKELLIGVTKFFRDADAMDALESEVIHEIVHRTQPGDMVRVWVPGCSTGEEAYSIAMLFLDQMAAQEKSFDLKVFATDIDRNAIEFGGVGAYPESIAADISRDRLQRYFVRRGENYHVSRQVRETVIFARHDLLKNPPFSKMDLVSCRNLLIYLKPETQQKVLSLFHFALNPDAYLLLGMSETVGEQLDKFDAMSTKYSIYRCRGESKGPSASGLPSTVGMRPFDKEEGAVNVAQEGTMRRDSLMESLYELLIESYAPPCLLLNRDNEVVHVFGELGVLFSLPRGKMTSDVMKLVHPDLSIPVSTALQRARKDGKEVYYKDIRVGAKDRSLTISIRVRPLSSQKQYAEYLLMSFEEQETAPAALAGGESFDIDENARQRIEDLEQELQYTKENLQATIEELETSNEELQATNEELLAANEELQSTNEELQSLNEELHTLNAEYQAKIQELTRLNNDVDNLLRSTDIGTLFIDRDLRIRKFTPNASTIFNLLPQDIGRPLDHLAFNLSEGDVVGDVKQVVERGEPVEREVRSPGGSPLLMRILPYRTDGDRTSGAVITLIPIDELKEVEESLRQERDLISHIADVSPSGIVVMNPEGRITFANAEAERLLGLKRDEVLGRMYNDSAWRVVDEEGESIADEGMPFSMVKRTGGEVRNVELHVETQETLRTLSVNAAPLQDDRGHLKGVVATIQDLTELTEATKKLGSNSRCRRAVLATDDQVRVIYWGRNACELYGVPSSDAVGKPVSEFLSFGEDGGAWEDFQEKIADGAVWKGETMLRHPEIGEISASLEAHCVAVDGTRVVFLNVRLL